MVALLLSLAPRAAPAQVAATPLAARIDAAANAPPLDRAHWGIIVEDAITGERLYGRNEDKLFIPASSLKLVVATVAARLLGPGFRYTTELLAAGPVRDGTIYGDLVLRGSGDPTLSGRYTDSLTAVWAALADSLRSRGIHRVDGRIIADASAWEARTVLGEWEAYDLLWWYAAPVAPLGFNDNSIDFTVAPGAVGEPAHIQAQPRTGFFTLRNRTTTVPAGRIKTLDFDRVPGTDTILAYGEIPADAPPRTEHFAVAEPARYAATVFRETIERAGIEVARDDVATLLAGDAVPANAASVLDWRSPPLDTILGPLLQSSQNWFAEQLLKTLGHRVAGEGSWIAGLEVERRFLIDSVRVDSTAFRLRDASGLSTGNLITPAALAAVLRYARAQRLGAILDALPVAGAETGSLRARFDRLEGRVRAKTGSMRNVASLSGFITDDDGRELVFVIIANGTGAATSATNRAIDQIVRAIAAR